MSRCFNNGDTTYVTYSFINILYLINSFVSEFKCWADFAMWISSSYPDAWELREIVYNNKLFILAYNNEFSKIFLKML
jgi:hypothetical protein